MTDAAPIASPPVEESSLAGLLAWLGSAATVSTRQVLPAPLPAGAAGRRAAPNSDLGLRLLAAARGGRFVAAHRARGQPDPGGPGGGLVPVIACAVGMTTAPAPWAALNVEQASWRPRPSADRLTAPSPPEGPE
jgi:hypothetical protein